MAVQQVAMRGRYISAMVLAGVGDSLGYRRGAWEFDHNGRNIHNLVAALGGLSKLENSLPNFCVSDDTIMHLATGRALVTHKPGSSIELLYNNFAHEYIKCMTSMSGRSPGGTCMGSCDQLDLMRQKDPKAKLYRIPFNKRGGGCGGAMRSMCIGLRYSNESDLEQLIAVSIESGRITHNHPTGYLGSLVSALFTSYALQDKPLISWGSTMVYSVLPMAKSYIESIGIEVQENLNAWSYFEDHWKKFLELRQISDGEGEPVYPESFDVEERDKYYTSISFSGWGGSAGHDSTIIAYDALIGSKGSWDELANRGIFHGGDNDSTGTIASSWFGALYGIDRVYEVNHAKVEFRDEMEDLANKLYDLSHPTEQS